MRYEDQIDTKEEFKVALYDIVEYLTKQEISNSATKLIHNYFNDSNADSFFERAVDAILKYFPESIPPAGERPRKLDNLLEALEHAANAWEAE